MLIFSYGSNMCFARLRRRVPSAELICVARLSEHQLRFHKRSTDGSGKADAHATGNADDAVWGVVYRIDPMHKPKLDKVEGLGVGYDEKHARVATTQQEVYEVQLYVAMVKDAQQVPYHWYKRYVLEGALQHGLPDAYVRVIKAQPSRADADSARASKHEAVKC